MTTASTKPQQLEFKTELKQLLDLIIHSLYTKQEIFLRELISNAADAIDKVRFEGLTNPDVLEGNERWKIKIIPDETAGTLTVSDNGIGMSQESIVDNLGTIAKSGTRAFLENLKLAKVQDRPELIGQFGVGFYASFMVADRVSVISRTAGPKSDGVKWISDGQGQYTIESIEKETRGTDVILHLRDEAKEFLSPWRIREIVKRYSDFIAHPIVMDIEKEAGEEDKKATTIVEETINSRQAIWLRPKHEIRREEYNEFYKQISRDFHDPLKTIHLAAEGGMEFRALMFIPAERGFDWMTGPEKKSGLDLYVRRVLIEHDCEQLVAPYLRFVKGVVDSADLPLNVSRETLQHNPLLAKIKSNVVNRILKALEEMKSDDYDNYLKFYDAFGQVLKEGIGQDFSNQQRLADLLLFQSTKTEPGKFTTLAKYLEGIAPDSDQKEIYYLTGESREMLESSPYLESFKAKGQEVLLLTDPIDEYVVSSLPAYKDKPLKAIDRSKMADEKSQDAQAAQQRAAEFKSLFDAMSAKLPEVKEVRLSARLKESAAVLVADEGAMTAHMERLMQRLGRGAVIPPSQRVLELNPDHPLVQGLLKVAQKDAADTRIEAIGRLLYDEALIAEGSKIKDPTAFAKRLNGVLEKSLAQ